MQEVRKRLPTYKAISDSLHCMQSQVPMDKEENMKPETIDFLKGKKILLSLWASGSETDRTTHQRFYLPLKDKCSLTIFSPRDTYLSYGKRKMNRMFLERIEKEKPDIIFMEPMHTEFYLETLAQIRKICDAKVVGMFSDDSWRFDEHSKHYAPFFDVVISVLCKDALKKYDAMGLKAVESFAGINTDYFKPMDMEKKYDVAFIGSFSKERAKAIEAIERGEGIHVAAFGKGWDNGYIAPDKLVETINQCRIILNFGFAGNGTNQIKGRIFEYGACGAFMLSEYHKDYGAYFSSDELVMFRDYEDMIANIRYYLQHEDEREEIADNMRRRIVKEYSLDSELDSIFGKVMECHGQWKDPGTRKVPFKWDYINIRFIMAGLMAPFWGKA